MTTMTEEQFNDCLSRVSGQRREKVLKYKFQAGREQSLKAYLLLQKLLKEEYGITEPPVFRELENGKPVIVGHEDIHFNMSHCRYAVACAISNKPVGIDVESVRSFKESLVRYTMNDEEVEQIMTAPRPEVAFIRLWTMKEARLKLTGEGINDNMKTVLNEADRKKYTTVECLERGYIYTVCESFTVI
jgi:4'-phosphopantetheinyl transferase